MPSLTRRTWLATAGMAPVSVGVPLRMPGRILGSTATARDKIRARYFPNIALITHEGRKVRFYDDLIKDKIVVLNFMYATCEGVCPGIVANLVKVQELLGKRVGRDIFMYSITLKPEEDTPKVLKNYAIMIGAKPGWWFLTGRPHDIELLRRKLGFVDLDPAVDKDKSQHIGNIRYGNEPLQWWAACPGLANPEWIVESILWVDGPNSKPAAKPSITQRGA